MAVTVSHSLYEILIRFNPDGSIKGAHQIDIERIMNGEDVLSEKEMAATALDPDLAAATLGEKAAGIIAENTALKAQGSEAGIAARDSEIAALKEDLAEFRSAVAATSIHKAYFRAALAVMGRLADVDDFMATQSALKQELWASATTIDITDADIAAVASALDIDLTAALTRATQIRAGDRG